MHCSLALSFVIVTTIFVVETAVLFPEFTDKTPANSTSVLLVGDLPEADKTLKAIFVFGVDKIPYVGPIFSFVVGNFWPEKKEDVFEEIQDRIKDQIDESLLKQITEYASKTLRERKRQMEELSEEVENGKPQSAREHYMQIARALIGGENQFNVTDSYPNHMMSNYHLLPLYSRFILMKVAYYAFGVKCASQIGIGPEDIRNVKKYAAHTVDEANMYINDQMRLTVPALYEKAAWRNKYDAGMSAAAHFRVYGLEYITVWNHILSTVVSSQAPDTMLYNDVVSYSTMFGFPTENLVNEALIHAILNKTREPLTPDKLGNGRRNKLKKITLHIWNYGMTLYHRIGGMELLFENGNRHLLGTGTKHHQELSLDGRHIKRITVCGQGAVDALEFELSDGSKHMFATCGMPNYRVFQLDGHYVASMFLSNDDQSLGGQAANFAVSYLPLEPNAEEYRYSKCAKKL